MTGMGTGNRANLVCAAKMAGFFPVGPPNVEPSWVPVPVLQYTQDRSR